jgi:hypothetical protein
MTERALHLLFPGWAITRDLKRKFESRFLFFPVTPGGLEESELGIADLAVRAIVPFGTLGPVLWLLQMSGYRVFS